MFSFLRKSLGIILTINFIVGLVVSGIVGYVIGDEIFWEGGLGLIIGIVVCLFIQSIVYGLISVILDIADTNEGILKALNKQENTLKSISTNTASNTTSSESVAGKNTWVCRNCGTTNPNATTICTYCKK